MKYEGYYDRVSHEEDSNHYFIKLADGSLYSQVESACFSDMENWKSTVGWQREEEYDVKQHAPLFVEYFPNHKGLTREEYMFWMCTLLDHPLLEDKVDTDMKTFGLVGISCELEHNYLLHLLGMLRAMREYPAMCKAAYKLYSGTKGDSISKNRKLARLSIYLSTQFRLECCWLKYNPKNGGGGHDPAGYGINLLDLSYYVAGSYGMGGKSYSACPEYDNISQGLRYHGLPHQGLKPKTLESLAYRLKTTLKGLNTWGELPFGKLKPLLGKMLRELDGVHKRSIAKKVKDKVEVKV